MPNLERILPRALIAAVVFFAICLCLVLAASALQAANRRTAQQDCRAQGGEVVLQADGSWCCARVEGR